MGPFIDRYLAESGVDAGPELRAERPARPEHGDVSINVAFQLARSLKRSPAEVAAALASRIEPGGPVGAVEVAGGFINFRLSRQWLLQRLETVVSGGDRWGSSDFGGGERVQVEFVSANPTGPLLVSHGRGRWGRDRAPAGVHRALGRARVLHQRLGTAGGALRPVAAGPGPGRGRARGRLRGGLHPRARPRDPKGGGRGWRGAVAAWGVQHYLEEFRAELAALGINFDRWFSERELAGDWETETIGELEAAGHITRHDDAVWLRLRDGKEEVLYRRDGSPTYFSNDLLYHRDKLVRRQFHRAICVWGADHQNQVRRLQQAMELIGVEPGRLVVILIQLVHLRGDEGAIKLSKRKGNIVALDELVRAVGKDPVRYFYLLRSSDAAMDFDIDLARRQSNENPVFYAQYAHARLCSVAAVAAEAGVAANPGAIARLEEAGEVALARELMELPEVVEDAARALQPHLLPHYAQRLAEKIHAFYHAGNRDTNLRVLSDDQELSGARLYLCEAARVTMANLLGLIGVAAPTRM